MTRRRDLEAEYKILVVMRSLPGARHYGYPLMRATRLRTGRFYLALGRLEDAGWIEGHFEDEPPQGRKPRRYYRLVRGA